MKVFISHKQEDWCDALAVSWILLSYGHTYYLDTVDKNIDKDGDDLSDYLRKQMGECDALIVILSAQTQMSWWVPWEIGVATEKNYPLSSCLSDKVDPPSYLKKWPILRSIEDVQAFASLITTLERQINQETILRKSLNEARRSTVPSFHSQLKKAIGQIR